VYDPRDRGTIGRQGPLAGRVEHPSSIKRVVTPAGTADARSASRALTHPTSGLAPPPASRPGSR
jgi:hypothetical protein